MKKFEQVVIKAWTEEVKDLFVKGRIVYERQMQAELFYILKTELSEEYEIWVEPIIYSESIWPNETKKTLVKPDLIITKCHEDRDEIIAIIELKCKPWGHPIFLNDCKKLYEFEEAIKNSPEFKIPLGYKPVSSTWNNEDKSNWCEFTVSTNCIMCLFVCARHDSDAITLRSVKQRPTNFLHLVGYYNDKLQAPEFRIALNEIEP